VLPQPRDIALAAFSLEARERRADVGALDPGIERVRAETRGQAGLDGPRQPAREGGRRGRRVHVAEVLPRRERLRVQAAQPLVPDEAAGQLPGAGGALGLDDPAGIEQRLRAPAARLGQRRVVEHERARRVLREPPGAVGAEAREAHEPGVGERALVQVPVRDAVGRVLESHDPLEAPERRRQRARSRSQARALGRCGVLAPALDPPLDQRAAAFVGAHRGEFVVDLPGVEQVARVRALPVLRQPAEEARYEQRRVRLEAVRERVERAAKLGVGREQEHPLGAGVKRVADQERARERRAHGRGHPGRDDVALLCQRVRIQDLEGLLARVQGRPHAGEHEHRHRPLRVVLGQVARDQAHPGELIAGGDGDDADHETPTPSSSSRSAGCARQRAAIASQVKRSRTRSAAARVRCATAGAGSACSAATPAASSPASTAS
jgi:hypothetical protein